MKTCLHVSNNKSMLMNRFLFLLCTLFVTLGASGGEIIVNEGESLHDALRKAREWRRLHDARCEGGILIRVKAGRHYMRQPLLIRPEDSGTATSPTIIRGEEGAILCGDHMQRHTQLYPQEGMARMIDFDKANRAIIIPTPPKSVLKQQNLEMVVHQRWAIAILRVKSMAVNGDRTSVTFQEPESRLEFEHPWPQPVIGGEKGNSSFLLRTTEQRDGIERLVVISGTEEDPVSHIRIEGLSFENTCWNRPLHQGHVTLQGGFPIVDAYSLETEGLPWAATLENQAWVERPVAAVSVDHASHVDVIDCQFRQIGSTALDYVGMVEDCTISGNRFEQIGGSAILAGSFAESPREVHRPYNHLARQCRRLIIRSNIIREATTEDWGAVGIGCGYVSDIQISGNEIDGVNYSGICVGWGWTPLYTGMENNHIIGNRIRNYARQLYDAGGIYTLSNQPGSSIRDNLLSPPSPAPYATNERGFVIYLDAETDGYTIANNRCDGQLIDKSQIGDNHPGPHVIIL